MHRLLFFASVLASVGCGRHEPIGVVLTYEVDQERDPAATQVPLKKVAAAVQKRLRGLAEVEEAKDDRIEVRVYGADSTKVERMLAQAGVMEFRILADRRDDRHRDVIAAAEHADADAPSTIREDGRVVGRWDRAATSEAEILRLTPYFVLRTASNGDLEALVMMDKS